MTTTETLVSTPWGLPRTSRSWPRRPAGVHRQPRRAEAQPGAVGRNPRRGPADHVHTDVRRRGLRGTHREYAAGPGDDREREMAVRVAEYFERYAPALPYLQGKGVGHEHDHAA